MKYEGMDLQLRVVASVDFDDTFWVGVPEAKRERAEA